MSSGLAIEALYLEDEYTFSYLGAEVTMQRIRAKSDTITAEVSVHWTLSPYDGLLHGPANTNLLADRTLSSIATHCQRQLDQGPEDFPWWKVLNQAKSMAIRHFRQGDPLIRLADITPPTGRIRTLLPDIVDIGQPTVMAAPGGSIKSYFALAAAAAVVTGRAGFLGIDPISTGPVVYLDWEGDAETHRERLEALCRPLGMEIPSDLLYRRESIPLAQSYKEVAVAIRKENAVMVVVDSKGAASAAPGEKDGTIDFFNAIRHFNCATLIVDHVTKAMRDRKQDLSPFGSIYTENLARRVWVAHKATPTSDGVAVAWKLIKTNNGRSGRLMALRGVFSEENGEESVRFHQISTEDPIFTPAPEGNTVKEQAYDHLKNSEKTRSTKEVADTLGAVVNTVGKALRELHEAGRIGKTGAKNYARWYAIPPVESSVEEEDELPVPW